MPVRVLLYEDNEPLRNSIKTLMQWNDAFELVAAMADSETLLADIDDLKPDVILMDIDMPPSNGVETVKLLRTRYADLPVIMLTVFDDNDNIVNSICAGANGYLLKKDIDQLMPAINDVMAGGAPMTSSIAAKVLKLFPGRAQKKIETENITPRETEILQLLIKGYSYKMIADELKISLETVRSHIKKVYKKLHVSSATEAIYKTTH